MKESEDRDPIIRWVLVSQNMMGAYGPFSSEQACRDFAATRRLPVTAFDTIPLLPPHDPQSLNVMIEPETGPWWHYYDAIRKEHGLDASQWCIDVSDPEDGQPGIDFNDPHPYVGATTLHYIEGDGTIPARSRSPSPARAG